MGKMYHKALVIGKFMPLHRGHSALIGFASEKAELVDVVALVHDAEPISLEKRLKWLIQDCEDARIRNARIFGYRYDPTELNPSSESDLKSSVEWADWLLEHHPDCAETDVIIGSEPYVKYMADHLGVAHIIYDESRGLLPISASAIREDPVANWDYLAPAVKRDYVEHICICGSESTGKSTVCRTLEDEFDCVTMIPEIGRCLVGKSAICRRETLESIFRIHRDLLLSVMSDPPTPFVLWDTDNLTTASYYSFLYPDEAKTWPDMPPAGKYFFFESSVLPYRDDNTRLAEDAALTLRDHHLETYRSAGVILEHVVSADRCAVVRSYILERSAALAGVFRG